MRDLRFLLSKEWVGYFAFLIVFAIVCVLLSNWQFARREEAATRNASIEANWDAAPVALADVVSANESVTDATRYRPVRLSGEYLTRDALLVRNRTYNGQAGFEQIVPFRDHTSGLIVIVSRGWITTGDQGNPPDAIPQPPTGTVAVVARLNAGEQSLGRSSPSGQIASISLSDIATILAADSVAGTLYQGGYAQLVSETPAAASTLALASKPTFDEGMHLSYAFQWIAFAVLGVFGFVYALRTTRRQLREDAATEQSDGEPGSSTDYGLAKKLGRRRPTDLDADYEDSVLESRSTQG